MSHIRSTVFTLIFLSLTIHTQDEPVRVKTDLTQTNVTVVDKNGRFVDGLTPDQFDLRIDGKPQPISFFERVVAGSTLEEQQLARAQNKEAKITGTSVAGGRTIVFFVDDLHLSLDSLKRTRDALSYFIDHRIGITDQVAIASSSGQIGFLQQLTNNKAVLRAAVARIKPKPLVVLDTEQPSMSEFIALRIEDRDRDATGYYVGRCVAENPGYTPAKCVTVVKMRAREILKKAAVITDGTFSSLKGLMRYAATVPGRKVVLLISDGFYLNARDRNTNSFWALSEVTDAAQRTGTIIYTIDARGLIAGQSDATNNLVDGNGVLDRGNLGEIPQSQDGLNALAEDTGGRAQRNSNSIGTWVRKTLDETSNYYLLAWHSEDEEERKFKQIEISVIGRPDLNVRLPRGYFAGTSKVETKILRTTGSSETGVVIDKATTPSITTNTPLALSLNYLDAPNVGGVLTSSVQIANGAFTTGGTTTVDLAGIILNDRGKQVGDFKTGLKVTYKAGSDDTGVIYKTPRPLPPGIYQVKVAARETQTGQVGMASQWIEIPDLSKNELTVASLILGVRETTNSDPPMIVFSVDHQFYRPLELPFLTFIYNASLRSGEIDLTAAIEVFDAKGQKVIDTPMRPVPRTGKGLTGEPGFRRIVDLSRFPLSGAVRDPAISPGTYLLRVTVQDQVTKKSATSEAIFTVK